MNLDKFRQDMDITICIFMYEICIESIANRALHAFDDRTFQVGVPAHMKLNAPTHVP